MPPGWAGRPQTHGTHLQAPWAGVCSPEQGAARHCRPPWVPTSPSARGRPSPNWCRSPPSYCPTSPPALLGLAAVSPPHPPPRNPKKMPERVLLGATNCSPLQPGSTSTATPPPHPHPPAAPQHCRPPHYSLGLSGTGNTPPRTGSMGTARAPGGWGTCHRRCHRRE